MKRVLRRLLVIVLVLSMTTPTLADGIGEGTLPGGSLQRGNAATTKGWGYRVTFGMIDDVGASLSELSLDSVTSSDLTTQKESIASGLKTRYLRPGSGALLFVDTTSGRSDSSCVVDSSTGAYAPCQKYNITNTTVSANDNMMAWQTYNPDWATTRPGGDLGAAPQYAFNSGLSTTFQTASSFGSADEWLADIEAKYRSTGATPAATVVQNVVTSPDNLRANLDRFSWASFDPANVSLGSATQRIIWDKIGYITTLTYFALAADPGTMVRQDMASKLWNWACAGYSAELTPILDFEAVALSGNQATQQDTSVYYYKTMPAVINQWYPSVSCDMLYSGWDSEQTDFRKAIGDAFMQGVPKPSHEAQLLQAFGGFWESTGNFYKAPSGNTIAQRKHCVSLNPVAGTRLAGYMPWYTYFWSGDPWTGQKRDDDASKGSFTWNLEPKGYQDKTPDQSVNAPSIITNLNISQSGFNKNNYSSEWVPYVTGDGIDCNQLEITVYRISQPLKEDQESNTYTREQVRGGGRVATVPINGVVVGDGLITNIPVLGTLRNGEKSRNLTDEELLDILRTGTGLAFQESISYPLVDESGANGGIRVTYAVYVTVYVACRYQQVFSNTQAEYIEYRSVPGTYSYTSDDPEGFAEIKCGYFDRDKGYAEPFEAMAGCPTTENLYFVSGGQEFVAQITYQYTRDKTAIRQFEQLYTTEQCPGYWTPCTKTFTDEPHSSVESWLATWTDSAHTSGEFINQSGACPECGTVHDCAGTKGKELHSTANITNTYGGGTVTPGDYYTECDLTATHWDFNGTSSKNHGTSKDPDYCSGAPAVSDGTAPGKCGKGCTGSVARVTRWSGTVKSYHRHFMDNSTCKDLTSSIRWEQDYTNMNYAKIKNVHVWRLEKAYMAGLDQVTMNGKDDVLVEVDELSNVIFNVAENDNAKEGRMYYVVNPTNVDHCYINDGTTDRILRTRGCCACHNHNAAEDLIASGQNPNTVFEDAWCISDYLVLEATGDTSSLLYHEYQSGNGGRFPILRIGVSGTSAADRMDNGYTITRWVKEIDPETGKPYDTGANGMDDEEVFRSWSERGKYFKSDDISFNTGISNAQDGTEEKICQNGETFYGGPVDENNDTGQGISWGGYTGDYSGTDKKLAEGADADEVPKYSGTPGKTNFKKGDKKVFKTGYAHAHQGETGGFSTQAPQVMTKPDSPFMLVENDIDISDYDCHNGIKSFTDSMIWYNNIISYGGAPQYSEEQDALFGGNGFSKNTNYSSSTSGINDVNIHNPVTAQYARVINLPDRLDQRTEKNTFIDVLNTDNGKCPGVANSCNYAHLNCGYKGTRYHTDDCYVKVSTGGLAQLPVTGNIETSLHPVEVKERRSGSQSYGYTGARQTFVAPETGVYHFDIYGASGGVSARGGSVGKGARAEADYKMNKGDTVYIYVGGQGGTGYNSGGYNGGGGGSVSGGGGGGMTHISNLATSAAAPSNCRTNGNWNQRANNLLIAGGGGGAGGSVGSGGNAGYPAGSAGVKQFGTAGGGGTQSAVGAAGTNNATAGFRGSGGSGTSTSNAGGGGGGAGWYGGGAGGNDLPTYTDIDDSGGGGGSSFAWVENTNLTNPKFSNGVRMGDGGCTVTWDFEVTVVKYVPSSSGSYVFDNSQADLIPATYLPSVYTAPMDGMYSVHLYGARGGGDSKGKPSAGGSGGYAGGQVYLNKGQKVLVTAGGVGSAASYSGSSKTVYEWTYPATCHIKNTLLWSETEPNSVCAEHKMVKTGRSRTEGGQYSGGYNGGGHGGNIGDSFGFGGGGATDIATKFVAQDMNLVGSMCTGGIRRTDEIALTNNGAFYWGPHITAPTGHIIRVDYLGTNLDKATFDSFAYFSDGTNGVGNCTLIHSIVTPDSAQLFWRVNKPARQNGQEFRVHGNGAVTLKQAYFVDLNDRIMVAGGGGGSDDINGTLNGAEDGRGGDGGGASGGNGYTDGVQHYQNAGATATAGYSQGIGENASNGAGGGGAGWYGGSAGKTQNSGGGGGSSNVKKVTNGITKSGQNSGAGFAVFVYPGCGEKTTSYLLSCSDPHHAPNTNRFKIHSGWKHEGGYECTGNGCTWCRDDVPLYSPSGYKFTQSKLNSSYIIKHNGMYHLTDGADPHCDQCGRDVTIDTYSLDNKTQLKCAWKTTTHDAAAFNTQGAISPQFHYSYGDDMCYDPCLNDENHKRIKSVETSGEPAEKAANFVVLDYDFEVYFPNVGDFYGNGALGIGATQKPEGYGYVNEMDTTIWLKEKFLMFPFDVTYNGVTYLAGEKVMLGYYDDRNHVWHDSQPDTYRYTFHCLLDNLESASARIRFCAIAKNTPFDNYLENDTESLNYSRYGNNKRSYHDAEKRYYLDVIGRIGVLEIEDTGDFRFSNYYKQAVDGWRVNQVVREVDIGKQNFVSVDKRTIFDDVADNTTKGQDTWGTTGWRKDSDKLRPFPLTPGENNVPALKMQAHRIGYNDYMSVVTVGNYYGENAIGEDTMRVQIQPYYYYYNLENNEFTPVDVYTKIDNEYRMINQHGGKTSVPDHDSAYNYYYDMNWQEERERRMYDYKSTDRVSDDMFDESSASNNVQNEYTQPVAGTSSSDSDMWLTNNIRLPSGTRWLHGTANMLFLRDGNRTFIGSRYRYGENTEPDQRIDNYLFNRQAQRHNFLLGLPTQSAFVERGVECTPENIEKLDMEKGVILVALDILARGNVWTLHYNDTPVSERVFELFGPGSKKIDWRDRIGDNKTPEGKPVVAVYTNAKTSRNDLSTEGTH